jgi:hypothetical protein
MAGLLLRTGRSRKVSAKPATGWSANCCCSRGSLPGCVDRAHDFSSAHVALVRETPPDTVRQVFAEWPQEVLLSNHLFYFPSHSFISLFNLSVVSLRVQPVHKDLCSQVYDSGETVPALKIQYKSFGRSGPDIWSTHAKPTTNITKSILFIVVSYSPASFRSNRPISTISLAMWENVLPSFKARSGSSRHSNIAIRCKIRSNIRRSFCDRIPGPRIPMGRRVGGPLGIPYRQSGWLAVESGSARLGISDVLGSDVRPPSACVADRGPSSRMVSTSRSAQRSHSLAATR